MRVVALISGGKDSCYNMVQCVAAGHDIVALANLRPENKADELDSYMYQTVGHQGVELYAEAMGLPLFRQPTQGVALLQEQVYTPTPEDEVEDLFQLLKKVKRSDSTLTGSKHAAGERATDRPQKQRRFDSHLTATYASSS
ncbi:Diphthine--ammonia ligase [Blattella germanica]|nr:Diphthine--ammonia ligase [Blattella germanica]